MNGPAPRDEIRVDLDGVLCLIGIFPEERLRTQPVTASVTLWLDLERSARTGAIGATINYADVAASIEKILKDGKVRLLETAGLGVLAYLLAPVEGAARPAKGRITLTKPRALGGAARASVTLERAAAELVYVNEILFTSPDATIERRDGVLVVSASGG